MIFHSLSIMCRCLFQCLASYCSVSFSFFYIFPSLTCCRYENYSGARQAIEAALQRNKEMVG